MSKSDDIKPEPVPELVGKTITEAHIVTDSAGNEDVVIRCSDGTVFIVTAWQEEGYPLYMGVSEKINRDVLKG